MRWHYNPSEETVQSVLRHNIQTLTDIHFLIRQLLPLVSNHLSTIANTDNSSTPAMLNPYAIVQSRKGIDL